MTTPKPIGCFARPLFLCLAFSCLCPVAWAESEEEPGVDAPPEDTARDRALAHYQNGRELLEQQNFQDAFPQLHIAYELATEAQSSNAWKILGSLGYCALQLERDGEALEFYREYLERGGEEIAQEERESIERELALIEGNLVTVQVSMGEEKFRVIVSRAGSLAPPQAYDSDTGALKLGLRAGTHVIAVEKGDQTLAQKRTTVKPGESKVLAFDASEPEETDEPPPTLAPRKEPSPAPPRAETARSSNVRPLRITSFAVGGLGVAGLISGVIFATKAGAARDEAYDEITSNPSLCRDGVCTSTAESRFDKADSLATTRSAFLVGGGVLLSAGVGLFVYDLKREKGESAIRVLPSFGYRAGSLDLVGTF